MEDSSAKEKISSNVNDEVDDDNNDAGSDADPNESLWDMALLPKENSPIPSKSSNEILSELFGAFNAEPPKSPELSKDDTDDDGLKSKKRKKKRKKERKHKKKSKTKKRSSDQDSSSNGGSSESDVDEIRKEKKHKRKKKRRKSSDHESIGDNEHHHPKKHSRHSRSPSAELETTQNGQPDVGEVPLPACAVKVPSVSETDNSSKVTPAFDSAVHHETPSEKVKHVPGKIIIKDLKFSSVYEATVKEVEEQAKAKAERYEEGEISDSSSSQESSVLSDDPAAAPSMESEAVDSIQLADKAEDQNHKRSPSKEKSSSHHKKSRHRSRSRSKDLESSTTVRDKEKDSHNKHRDKERSKDSDKEKDKEKEKVKEKDKCREREKEKEREKKRDKDRERVKHKDRERSKDRDRHRDKKDRDKDRDRDRDRGSHRDKRRGRSRSRSRSPHTRRRSCSSHRRRHSRDRHRSRSHSRDRKRSSDHIDKKKLLEIARRNAMNMLQAGILPATIMGRSAGAPNVSVAPSKPEKNAAKTVDELTEYCKELSKRENLGELSSLSGSDDSDSEKPFHHPFQVKDRPTVISLNIKNAVQLPVKSVQERTIEQSQLRMQFPVSSGQQHRKTEGEWVPVTPQKTDPPVVDKKTTPLPKPMESVRPKPAQKDISEEIVDIGALVSQRLSVMRKKHDNESQASNLYDPTINQQIHGWSNTVPAPSGQFTGNTGVRLLTPQQLAAGTQAWARKDQLQTATPVRSGMGMALLQKMGWKPGEGLGKNKEGCQEPLQLEVKMDRKGLVAAEEMRKRVPPPVVMPAVKVPKPTVSVEGKHPVSLLTEYCSKRHFGAPHFELCLESGPDHKKDFLFKVRVNGLEYKPERASPNKKQAKAEAATVCLKALGVLLG